MKQKKNLLIKYWIFNKRQMERHNDSLNNIFSLNNKNLKTIEEQLYCYFSEVESKIGFLKYLENNYLPFYNSILSEYEKLDEECDGNYYNQILIFEYKKIEYLKNWLNEKSKFYFSKESVAPRQEKSNLTLPQIALIHIYKKESITRDNGKEIAKKYSFNSKNSGEKLYQIFIKYYKATDRKGEEQTIKKTTNKKELIESIIDLLPNDKQKRAKDEVEILKNILNNEY